MTAEVNKSIIEQQLRYCKNPADFLNGNVDESGDPRNPLTTACAVLYSGDYASDKKSEFRPSNELSTSFPF